MDDIKEIINSFYGAIPLEVQNFIKEGSWKEQVASISTKHGLNEEQKKMLENETLLTLLTVQDVSMLPTAIETELQVPPEKAKEISIDIEQVLSPVKEMLAETVKAVNEALESPEEKHIPATAPAPSNLPELPEEHRLAIRQIETNTIATPQPSIQKGIEVKTAQPTQTPTILATRLGTSFNLPHEEVKLNKPEEKTQAKVGYTGKDPYREPIE